MGDLAGGTFAGGILWGLLFGTVCTLVPLLLLRPLHTKHDVHANLPTSTDRGLEVGTASSRYQPRSISDTPCAGRCVAPGVLRCMPTILGSQSHHMLVRRPMPSPE